MIYSVSVRTDVPAFYGDWFMDKLKKGEVGVRNPYYPEKVSIYDITPDQVDCFCFLSKNYGPFLKYVPDILRDYAAVFDYTITPYHDDVEPRVPGINQSISYFKELSKMAGKKCVNLRYDPLFLSHPHKRYDITYLKAGFEYILSELTGYTERAYFSFISMYKKVQNNFKDMRPLSYEEKDELLWFMVETAEKYGMILQCCPSQVTDMNPFLTEKIETGGCFTAEILNDAYPDLNVKVSNAKNNKMDCSCIISKDLGRYDTCLHDCTYCYANTVPGVAENGYADYDPSSLLLRDTIRPDDIVSRTRQRRFRS